LNTADVNTVVAPRGLTLHQYADDCQLYLGVLVAVAQSVADRLAQCVADVAEWLTASRLRLNPATTIVIWLGSRQQLSATSLFCRHRQQQSIQHETSM